MTKSAASVPPSANRLTKAERAEHARLCRVWARQRATVKQIHRCMQLSRRLENEIEHDFRVLADKLNGDPQ
jgi:hypothetical protein